ncbi:unnamed protein product [Soboliphyme baturini]|uniref:Uncharacterized protein n=1 Tax=Soboliphyme baturini TaxID=241478 RepID=A0A183IWN5_9BILA|nr:unnamed protein product [Soboliphyme baturini]
MHALSRSLTWGDVDGRKDERCHVSIGTDIETDRLTGVNLSRFELCSKKSSLGEDIQWKMKSASSRECCIIIARRRQSTRLKIGTDRTNRIKDGEKNIQSIKV